MAAVHRFWDTRLKEFVYTYGAGEPADWRKNPIFNRETIIGFAATTQQPGSVRLYRAYCRDQRHYFYLNKPASATDIERMESFELYVWTTPGNGRIAMHACFLPDDKDAYFDSSLPSIKEYVETTQKETGQKRKVIEAMFYLYSPGQQPKQSVPSSTPIQPPPKPINTDATNTELAKVRRVSNTAFSNDGKWFATIQALHEQGKPSWHSVQLWDLPMGKLVDKLYQSNDQPKGIAFSPDGTKFACITDFGRELSVWDLTKKLERLVILMPKSEPAGGSLLAFAHDGASVLVGGKTLFYRISIKDRSTAEIPFIRIGDNTGRFALSPSAPILATMAVANPQFFTIDTNTGDPKELLMPPGSNPHELVFSGDGQTMAITRVNSIDIWDTKTWKVRTSLKIPNGESLQLSNLSLSKDAKTVACLSRDGFIKRSQRLNVWSGDKLTHRAFGPGEIWVPEVSADGKLIAAIKPDEDFAILETATGQPKVFPR